MLWSFLPAVVLVAAGGYHSPERESKVSRWQSQVLSADQKRGWQEAFGGAAETNNLHGDPPMVPLSGVQAPVSHVSGQPESWQTRRGVPSRRHDGFRCRGDVS